MPQIPKTKYIKKIIIINKQSFQNMIQFAFHISFSYTSDVITIFIQYFHECFILLHGDL